MLEVRIAVPEDKESFRALWRICFGDSERFMDWFFSERFFPEFSVCLLEDGQMMSALQSYPLHIRLRGKILSASMLAGVSTHPERNGRGYMKQIFLRYMQRVRELAIPVVIHTPAHLSTFFSRGHYPATRTAHLTIGRASAPALPKEVARQDLYAGLAPLQSCYQRCTARYSGAVSRTMADFAYKLRDYGCDGGKCLVVREGNDARGYCVYYTMEESVHAEECFAQDEKTLSLLLDALSYEAQGRKLHVKLPPDTRVSYPGAGVEVREQGVMGVADVSQTLGLLLGDDAYVFELTDSTVPENAGVWDGRGNPSGRAPHIRLEAGRLAQFLCGYSSLNELSQAGLIEVYDAAALAALDAVFPKEACFVTDEY